MIYAWSKRWNKHMASVLVFCMTVSMLLGSWLPAAQAADLAQVVVKLSPSDDASVNKSNTASNSATGTLVLGAGRQFWMKFDLSSISDPIESATLKLYKTNANAANFSVFRSVYDNWTQSTLTWNTQPPVPGTDMLISGTCAANPCVASGGAGTLVSINLTDTIKNEVLGDKILSLVFKRDNIDATPGADLASKEHITSGWRPSLEVTTLKALTPAERVASDKAQIVSAFANKTVTNNLELPLEGAYNSTIVWSSSHPSVLTSAGVVTRPEYTLSDVPVTLTATVTYNSVTDTAVIPVTVQRMPTPTAAERVAKDKSLLISQYNNMTVYENVYLQPTGSYGFSTITWQSDRPELVSNTGVVNRPGVDQQDATVRMSVTLAYGTVTDSTYIQFVVPKLAPRTEAKLTALQSVIAEAGKLKEQFTAGSAAGQVPQHAKDAFAASIQSAALVLNDPSGDPDLALDRLRAAGKTYIAGTVISNAVVDAKRNTLAFSSYRQELLALVWEARTELFLGPELHTQASKLALQEQIDHAEAVLNGSYSVPFTRNREFNKPRPDEDIQFAIDHYSKASNPFGEKYGLKEMLAWYKANDIMAGTYNTIKLYPADDAFVWTTEKTSPHNGNTLIYGEGRYAFMKFDLSSVTAKIAKAELRTTNFKTDRNTSQVHYEANDSWQEGTLVYPPTGDPVLGPIVGSYILGSKDAIAGGFVDLTGTVQAELLGDKLLSLSFDNAAGTRFASEIYSNQTADTNKRPYLELSLHQIVDAKLQEKYNRAIAGAQALISQAVAGTATWQYPASSIDAVKAAVTAAEQAKLSGSPETIGAAMVRVYDAMAAMRDTQVLRTENEPAANLYFTEEGLQELRSKINQNPALKAKYDEAKALSDAESLEDLIAYRAFLQDPVNYDELNAKYKLWSPSATLNFKPPTGTKTISLQFTLETKDNEAAGLGHAWIDSIKISPSDAADLSIANASFEEGSTSPSMWQPVAVKGNPVMRWENRTNYANEGTRSLYIENPTSEDQGSWISQQEIEVTAGIDHTLTFAAKLDGKMNTGVKAIVTYKNEAGAALGTTELFNNKKSTLGGGSNLSVQADALVYAVTGDITYAKKAKERIYYKLNDFLQGAEYWQLTNARPDGIDAYGKVQGGRVASIIATAYTFIKNAGVYSEDEYKDLIQKLTYFNQFLNDRRDRNELDDVTVQAGTSNWETDAVIGASMLSMVFPELPGSKQQIANANKLIKAQLQYQVGPEGEWPESVRYLVAVLQRLAVYAKALRNETGEDLFANPKLVKMFEYNLSVQTPPYAYTNGKINSPIFGDDVVTNGNEFALLGIYYDEVGRTNEALASRMLQTWKKAGAALPLNGLETILLESFFTPLSYVPAYTPLSLQSTDKYKGVGLVMFRNRFGTPKESFMSIMANRTALGHGHFDQGAFTLYANSEPLVLDPGIESYFAGTRGWYVGSSSHSTVQFRRTDNTTYVNTPAVSTEHAFTSGASLDTMSLRIADPNSSTGSHLRKIAYIKDGLEAYIMWDQIKNSSNSTIWNLPVAASRLSDIQGNKITSAGHYTMDLETTVLQPENPSITQEWGRMTNALPSVEGEKKMNYIRVTNEPNSNYLTVLYPKLRGTTGLASEKLTVSAAGVDLYRLAAANGKWAYIALNNGTSTASLTLETDRVLQELTSGQLLSPTAGQVTLSIAPGEMAIAKPPAEPPVWPEAALIQANAATANSLSLVWTPATGVVSYDLKVGNNWYMNVTDATYQVSGLTPSTAYPVEVYASNADGDARGMLRATLMTEQPAVPVPVWPAGAKVVSVDVTRTGATLRWDAADGAAGYDVKVGGTWYKHMSGTTYTVTGLMKNTDYTVEIHAYNEGGFAAQAVTGSFRTMKDNSDDNPASTGSLPSQSNGNGKGLNSIGADGKIDADALKSAWNGKTSVELQVPGDRADLPASALTEAANTSQASVTIQSVNGSVVLPLQVLKLDAVAQQLGVKPDELNVSLSIRKLSGDESRPLGSALASAGITPLSEAVDFTIHVETKDGKSVSVNDFGSTYVKRTIPLTRPSSKTATVALFDPATGSLTFVPSIVGTASAEFMRPGNSIYTVVELNKSFADLTGHWAKADVELLASKLIAGGASANAFEPDRSITRAEFAALLVRSLGLTGGSNKQSFSDVPANAWYAGVVGVAGSAGLIGGYEDGTFRPDRLITREELAAMIVRALRYAGQSVSVTDARQAELLSRYADADRIVWAKQDLAIAIGESIMNGLADGKLGSDSLATRAEAAAMLKRFLLKTRFIEE